MKKDLNESWVGVNSKSDVDKSKLAVQMLVPIITALFIIGYWLFAFHIYNNNNNNFNGSTANQN